MLTSNRNTKDYNQTYLDGENVSLKSQFSVIFEKSSKLLIHQAKRSVKIRDLGLKK